MSHNTTHYAGETLRQMSVTASHLRRHIRAIEADTTLIHCHCCHIEGRQGRVATQPHATYAVTPATDDMLAMIRHMQYGHYTLLRHTYGVIEYTVTSLRQLLAIIDGMIRHIE